MEERRQLEAAIADAHLSIDNLTSMLDESPAAEHIPDIGARLERFRRCLIELERTLELLD
ncbi:MAG: hypothetical protein WD826_06640 [Actinomycetota bacterium]